MRRQSVFRLFTPHGAQITLKRRYDGVIMMRWEKEHPTILTFTSIEELMLYLNRNVFGPVFGRE